MELNALGTVYSVKIEDLPDDKKSAGIETEGFCNKFSREIVVYCKSGEETGVREVPEARAVKETLRHEIIHAFLNESGLRDCSQEYNGPWALNEEMVDWFAIQAPKIFEAFIDTGCVDG